ncbi:hypothetical protein [Candidatus Amarobacter glycogenicus]|uniref:hypothetical protein n=1 Tax=Candidatus Amarobacter glycogenicus TaxID=3140699 RepID=UPI0031376807|nr:hypothetical protein [Dehalococcoidia bacterium]
MGGRHHRGAMMKVGNCGRTCRIGIDGISQPWTNSIAARSPTPASTRAKVHPPIQATARISGSPAAAVSRRSWRLDTDEA